MEVSPTNEDKYCYRKTDLDEIEEAADFVFGVAASFEKLDPATATRLKKVSELLGALKHTVFELQAENSMLLGLAGRLENGIIPVYRKLKELRGGK